MTTQEMREELIAKYAAIPEREIITGVYVHTIGSKYVTILDTWGGSTLRKELIKDFYE